MKIANGAVMATFVLLAAMPAAQAAARLKLTIQTQHAPKAGSRNVPADDTRQVDVVLDADHISAAWARRTTVYDFQRRRRLVLDDAERSYVDYSLYDVVGSRSAELAHRQKMAGAMGAAGLQDALPSLLDEMHVLAVARAGQPAPVESAGGTAWSDAGGKPLARRGEVLLEAGPDDVRAYAQLLRYMVGGHPKILAALARGKGIPQQLVFTFRHTWGERTSTVTVSQLQALAQAPGYELSGWNARSPAGAGALDELLDRAAALDAPTIQAQRERVAGEADAAWSEGRVFQAFLGSMEGYLMTGGKPPRPFTPRQLEQVRAEPSVRLLNGILSARTQEQYAQAVGMFAPLRVPAGPKAYVLQVFEANDRIQLGEVGRAVPMFAEVLRANPALAGVYKDLGDALFLQFDGVRAWRSWDAGRRIAPAFENFRKVDEFETRLAQDFPEYF
jgi:hypothetical protein